ncbi:MAG: response regulator transcription factor [Chloroflexota bacterium]
MNTSDSIRILLVDDHDIVRKGIAVFLATCDDFVLVGEASSGEEAIELCKRLTPDVILMDLVMPGLDGIDAIRKILETIPDIQIIALTSYSDDTKVQEALQAGAIGFLHKNISIDALAAARIAAAIRAAAQGQPTLSPEATKAVVRAASTPSTPDHNLTPREKEALGLLVEGYNNVQIAQELVIGRATVKSHVSNILEKLDVGNRQEAIAKSLREKLVK